MSRHPSTAARMCTVLAIVGALSLGSAVVAPTVVSAHTASDTPSLKLSPSTGVLAGSRVLASGAGWARGSASLFECASEEQNFDSTDCDLLKTVAIPSSGRWSKAFWARAGSLGNGGGNWCDSAEVSTCYVGMTQGATTVNAVLTYKLPSDVILPRQGSYIDESTATVKVVNFPAHQMVGLEICGVYSQTCGGIFASARTGGTGGASFKDVELACAIIDPTGDCNMLALVTSNQNLWAERFFSTYLPMPGAARGAP